MPERPSHGAMLWFVVQSLVYTSWVNTGGPSSQYEELHCVFFFSFLCERSAKRDMGHILCYLTIELDHAKRDSRLAAYGGVLLQRLEGLNL